jgi:hypothetical protein
VHGTRQVNEHCQNYINAKIAILGFAFSPRLSVSAVKLAFGLLRGRLRVFVSPWWGFDFSLVAGRLNVRFRKAVFGIEQWPQSSMSPSLKNLY